jgi:hypothetical protein
VRGSELFKPTNPAVSNLVILLLTAWNGSGDAVKNSQHFSAKGMYLAYGEDKDDDEEEEVAVEVMVLRILVTILWFMTINIHCIKISQDLPTLSPQLRR